MSKQNQNYYEKEKTNETQYEISFAQVNCSHLDIFILLKFNLSRLLAIKEFTVGKEIKHFSVVNVK